MKERFAVENPKAQQMRFHVQTGGVTLTAQQPDNNVVRVALQALAAVLGGCQSLHTNGKDEALALPTEAAARTALRTQQVIAFETGVADTVDPLGGSYAVEAATDQLEREALGSSTGSRPEGARSRPSRGARSSARSRNRPTGSRPRWKRGSRVIVGVNRFREDAEEAPMEILRIDPALERQQVDRVRALRARRPAGPWKAALDALGEKARTRENLMPALIDAVLAWATVGEIAGRLREVFGEHRETLVL